jgi:ABC-type sugar transport system permease subunit
VRRSEDVVRSWRGGSGRSSGWGITALWEGWQRHKAAYLFILPSFAAFLLFTAYPLVDTLVFSFQDLVGGQRIWVGLTNYRSMLEDSVFLAAAKNTGLYFLVMVPGGVAFAVLLAGLISALPSERLQVFFKAAFYLPLATVSSVMLALVWTYLYDPSFGFLNYLLSLAGLPPQEWLSNPRMALLSLAIMMHTQWWGGMVILLAASMATVPTELYEAAKLDGASRIAQFTRVTLPLIRPAIAYVAIIATISSFRIFNEIALMTRGGPGYSTINIAYDIWQTGINEFNFGPAAAYSSVLLAVTVGIAVVQYRILNARVEY